MIHPSLEISPKWHVPVPYIGEKGCLPHQCFNIMLRMRHWSARGSQNGDWTLRREDTELVLTPGQASNLLFEWEKLWKSDYLPPFPLEGKSVLDAGAGCGETAYFFLAHGASSVIAIESDPRQLELLRSNIERNNWKDKVKVISRGFELEDLSRERFDFAKMDIEGGESSLLSLEELPFPITIEVHGNDLCNEFIRRFGLKVFHKVMRNKDVWLVGNHMVEN